MNKVIRVIENLLEACELSAYCAMGNTTVKSAR